MTEHASRPIDPNMGLDQAVPSKSNYLGKDDLAQPALATISHMTMDDIQTDGRTETRSVLHFDGETLKPLILNQTNKELLKGITGATTVGELRGKEVVLYNDTTIMFQGKLVGGVRIRARKPAAQPEPPQYDDDIPF